MSTPGFSAAASLRIRGAKAADAATLSRIANATFALACPPSTPAADLRAYAERELTAQRFAEHLAAPSVHGYLAECGGGAVAYLMLSTHERSPLVEGKAPLQLWRLYVLPEHHGRGVADALIWMVFEYARRLAHDVIWLGVSRHNHRALAFYRKHGFSEVGHQQFRVGNDVHDDVVMTRPSP